MFRIVATDGAARRGVLETAHGEVETPAFMPVGTRGAVKGLDPERLTQVGASILLANFYHLSLRPGIEAIAELGGLHEFVGWQRPILTDSGGYQVFSLAKRRRIDAGGVSFRSHLDGSELRLTPTSVALGQARLGVDVAMVLDECPPWPAAEEQVATAVARTTAWARRAREAWKDPAGTRLFGIVQGGVYERLRERSAGEITALDFDGYAVGGVSVGEPTEDRRRVVETTAPLLPAERPRYLMGLGTPLDILHAVGCGVDLFDCVLPSRNARHGVLFTSSGPLRIKNARFARDSRPVLADCPCPCCTRVSRAFLHHLFRAGEITGKVLATAHNVRFYLDFVRGLREAIAAGTAAGWAASFISGYTDPADKSDPDS